MGTKRLDVALSAQLQEYYGVFDRSAALLRKEPWFRREWIAQARYYPPEKPEVASFHVSKPHWFNEEGRGIHFETYMGPREAKKHQLALVLHILHLPKIPGTDLNRRELARRFVDRTYERIRRWKGYRFRAGRYGVQPFGCILTFDWDTVEGALAAECARLCQELGPDMETCLNELGVGARRSGTSNVRTQSTSNR